MKNDGKINYFYIASSFMLLAIFFGSFDASAQIPKLLLKFAEKHNKVQSGYVKLQLIDINIENDTIASMEEDFFITTPKDIKSLVYSQERYTSSTYCKSAHTVRQIHSWKDSVNVLYRYNGEEIEDAKINLTLHYFMAGGMSVDEWKTHKFRRIPPKINKKNVRYKITCPDQGIFSNINREWEFDRKTFYLIQAELSVICAETFPMGNKIDILEQRLYDCIHPDILDTISFTFEKIKKEYDRQCAEKQAQRDSLFRAALSYSKAQLFKDTQFPFMPEWKFPLLSGDTLYSDSINSRFLLMDMWFINCPPCMKAMRELSSIDTLYEESLLKMVSINAFDKDTAQISKVVKNLSLQCDIACAYDEKKVNEMSKKMGKCQGYPQLYLIDMETRQVIWHSCGWYEGFTKDIEEIIKASNK